ncbi:hypothetical protein NDU88_008354 [Pleurodeles waltl]|uniref:Uncharacterized protein n=1 Tax=Pleurodeles waltl TaxID=8319 RepID=A0AAV7N4Q5_PLEWA|nr:hypothetical protein NDU88_008354 [Pleurodeles waltl]
MAVSGGNIFINKSAVYEVISVIRNRGVDGRIVEGAVVNRAVINNNFCGIDETFVDRPDVKAKVDCAVMVVVRVKVMLAVVVDVSFEVDFTVDCSEADFGKCIRFLGGDGG